MAKSQTVRRILRRQRLAAPPAALAPRILCVRRPLWLLAQMRRRCCAAPRRPKMPATRAQFANLLLIVRRQRLVAQLAALAPRVVCVCVYGF